MGCLKDAVVAAEEVVCVVALAAVLGTEGEAGEPQVNDVVEAVQDYHGLSHATDTRSWIMDRLYSDKTLRWLAGRVISVASEQGAFDIGQEERQVHEPGSQREV